MLVLIGPRHDLTTEKDDRVGPINDKIITDKFFHMLLTRSFNWYKCAVNPSTNQNRASVPGSFPSKGAIHEYKRARRMKRMSVFGIYAGKFLLICC